MIQLKSPQDIDRMRRAGRIVAAVHDALEDAVQPGITTYDLDRMADELIRKHGAVPSFKGYRGYEYAICASKNNVVVHGLPSKKDVLRDGDVIGIDLGAYVDGFHGDSARTHRVGRVSGSADRLLRVTEECLYAAVDQCRPDVRLGDVGYAIESHAKAHGFGVVTEFVGHGIGRNLHEDPQIPHVGPPGKRERLRVGMVIAIEPMINEKGPGTRTLPDKWTVVTLDGGLSAHYEHTIAITDTGPELLTMSERHPGRLTFS